MSVFREMYGAVYILENKKAQRVKVGMTINDVKKRVGDVNDKWLGIKATCQVCGKHRLVKGSIKFPKHNNCPGGNELPLEKDSRIAKSHLKEMKECIKQLSGSEKNSAIRIINSLEKRIGLYRHYKNPIGMWQIHTVFYTECAEQVELLSHDVLETHLDKKSPIGEVFSCSIQEASDAVESVLHQLRLFESARKEVRNDSVSEENGTCIICDGYLTERGSCPECIQRFLLQ